MTRSTASLLLLLLVACSRKLEAARPVAEEFVEIDYPPPPAQIEERDEELAGRPDCRWLDGHYEWRGKRWQWLPGSWIVPPNGCSYAPGLASWSKPPSSRLYYTPPRWYRADGKAACPAPIQCQKSQPRAPE
jgi:hypothetical protein